MPLRSERSALTWDEAVRSYRLSLQDEGKRRDTLKSSAPASSSFVPSWWPEPTDRPGSHRA